MLLAAATLKGVAHPPIVRDRFVRIITTGRWHFELTSESVQSLSAKPRPVVVSTGWISPALTAQEHHSA
jgi:hypothetical protein